MGEGGWNKEKTNTQIDGCTERVGIRWALFSDGETGALQKFSVCVINHRSGRWGYCIYPDQGGKFS